MLAVVFSALGFYFLLRRIDLAFHFVPLRAYGAEGGLIEIAIDNVFGAGASFIALMFAFIHFIRARRAKLARALLAWCCLLVAGFIGFFVYDVVA